jgi:transposase InsO family protein
MAYNTNPKLPNVRRQAVFMVRQGHSTRVVARHFGFSQSAVVKWCQRAPRSSRKPIVTKSSAPHHCPRALSKDIVARIIDTRAKHKRCAEVIQQILKREGVIVSLSSVKRTLSRYGMLKKRSPWKKIRQYPPRPHATSPGILVEMDTIHFVDKNKKRRYVYTAIDVYSRYGFALCSDKSNTHQSVQFLRETLRYFPFSIHTIQTDNGPEFGLHFTKYVELYGLKHRHNHPRSPNENGHLERFNRTIQEEITRHGLCIFIPDDVATFIHHYNHERIHMGIEYQTPAELIPRC